MADRVPARIVGIQLVSDYVRLIEFEYAFANRTEAYREMVRSEKTDPMLAEVEAQLYDDGWRIGKFKIKPR